MALIWGVNFSWIKIALVDLHPLAFNAIRFALASGTVLLIFRAVEGLHWPAREDWARVVFLGILGNVVYQGFFIFGIANTLAGNASLILATTPVWTMALSTLRGHERVRGYVWIGGFGTLVGMVLVVLGSGVGTGFQSLTIRGDLLMVGAALTWSLYTVGCRGMIQKYGSLPVTAWTLGIGSIGLVAMGILPLARAPLASVSVLSWAGVVYSGVFGIGIAYLLWYRGVQSLGNARTAVYSNLVPVVALVVAWIWIGEVPRGLQLLGAAVIIGGLSLARFQRRA
jgi:drug/metabolite transporter (DMT)-like permease